MCMLWVASSERSVPCLRRWHWCELIGVEALRVHVIITCWIWLLHRVHARACLCSAADMRQSLTAPASPLRCAPSCT